MLCWGYYQGCSTESPLFFYWVKMTWGGQELTYVFFEISAHVSLGREVSSFAEGSDLFVSCVFMKEYGSRTFSVSICWTSLSCFRQHIPSWFNGVLFKNLKGKQREFNVRGVIGVFQSRYYCDDFSVSEFSVEDAVSVFQSECGSDCGYDMSWSWSKDCECMLGKIVWELRLDFIFLGSNFDNAAPQKRTRCCSWLCDHSMTRARLN